jgi:hypothetical protein
MTRLLAYTAAGYAGFLNKVARRKRATHSCHLRLPALTYAEACAATQSVIRLLPASRVSMIC